MNAVGKVLSARWFAESICIVRVKNADNQIVYYIGYSEHHDHEDAQLDVALWGVVFPKKAGDVLFDIER